MGPPKTTTTIIAVPDGVEVMAEDLYPQAARVTGRTNTLSLRLLSHLPEDAKKLDEIHE